jgi:hypothetical protein
MGLPSRSISVTTTYTFCLPLLIVQVYSFAAASVEIIMLKIENAARVNVVLRIIFIIKHLFSNN